MIQILYLHLDLESSVCWGQTRLVLARRVPEVFSFWFLCQEDVLTSTGSCYCAWDFNIKQPEALRDYSFGLKFIIWWCHHSPLFPQLVACDQSRETWAFLSRTDYQLRCKCDRWAGRYSSVTCYPQGTTGCWVKGTQSFSVLFTVISWASTTITGMISVKNTHILKVHSEVNTLKVNVWSRSNADSLYIPLISDEEMLVSIFCWPCIHRRGWFFCEEIWLTSL